MTTFDELARLLRPREPRPARPEPADPPPLPRRNPGATFHERTPMCASRFPDDRPDPITRPEEHADWLFDVVSGTLRDRPQPGAWADPPSRATKAELRDYVEQAAHAYRRLRLDLVAADAKFDELHQWITSGNELPDPWRKHYVPREDAD